MVPRGRSKSKLYIVEKILDRREVNGHMEYHIQWLGFKPGFNSWEPEEGLRDVKGWIMDYERAEAEKYEKELLAKMLKEHQKKWACLLLSVFGALLLLLAAVFVQSTTYYVYEVYDAYIIEKPEAERFEENQIYF